MSRAKVECFRCTTCDEPIINSKMCKRCKEIGGGYVPEPPPECRYAHLSPIGDHPCAQITDCGYKCENMNCHWWKKFNRVGAGPRKVGKVVFK